MGPTFVHYLPLVTTGAAIFFSRALYLHWRTKPHALYLFWWMIGGITYGAGTFTESITTLFGWSEPVFKAWYISGAFLGGVPLAQGTVYLLLSRKVAHRLTAVLLVILFAGSALVVLSPIDHTQVEAFRLSGAALAWKPVRLISPFINIYAFIFLVGGAALSAWKYRRSAENHHIRYAGNIWIAIGALLPGIAGSSARAGYVEVLYITELIGLLCIWYGYHIIRRNDSGPGHP
jgi:hypothetical protein